MTLRVATDVGGTFTDLVAHDPRTGAVTATKVPSTPADASEGVFGAVDAVGLDLGTVSAFLHGCTVVINAITERAGARTALVTTRGFRDVLEIARGNRPDMYDLRYRKPVPLVPRRHRFELTERVDAAGGVLLAPVLSELESIAATCRAAGIEAVAICLLHSYANPAHEHAVRDTLVPLLPGVSLSLSSDVSRQWREYERTSTVVLNGYVQPVVERYLGSLDAELTARRLAGERRIMQSSGGTASLQRARAVPINLVESGPAAGITGAAEVGRRLGEPDLLYLDIGGTTAKCTLIRDGIAPHTTDYRLERTPRSAGIPVAVPVVDIVEIGAGGGSIAALDDGGALQVGPRSAGAVPGPACFGRGDQPTVTDAMLVAGVLDPGYFLGGRMQVDREAARAALGRLGAPLGLPPEQVATGVIRLANAKMINALRIVSVHRGHDPRDFTLVASGGGGGLHAAALGDELRVRRIVIPPLPGYFSAWGMLVAEPRVDLVRTLVGPLEAVAGGELADRFAELEREAVVLLGEPDAATVRHRHGLELRYRGQEHGVDVDLEHPDPDPAVVREAFHAAHRRRYTFDLPDEAVEVVTLRLATSVATPRPPAAAPAVLAGDPHKGERAVDLDGTGPRTYAVLDRERLAPGFSAAGPLLVEEPSSTTLVLPGQALAVDAFGNLVLAAAS